MVDQLPAGKSGMQTCCAVDCRQPRQPAAINMTHRHICIQLCMCDNHQLLLQLSNAAKYAPPLQVWCDASLRGLP